MWQPTLSPDNQHALDEAWAHHRAKFRQEQPRIRPLWFVLGWTFGLPTAVWLITSNSSAAAFFWWAVFGYVLISTWYGYWREKALAACYMRMSDAFANYVMEKDDLQGALAWQEALAADKRRLKILNVPFPTIQDRDDASDREIGF
jgi:hypothetical protein